ncbi:MAG TPA: shikimate kinase [Terriglobales bacterium]|nr:shikimate kinase [Terriglobales bacterium]
MPSRPPIASPLVLVGFMGCGKTTVGRLLAQHLGWHFCDLDDRIEAAAGVPIPTIFAQRGEPAFREIERSELLQALGAAAGRPTVLAVGGGTVVQAHNWDDIRASGGSSVYLEVPLDELLERCAGISNRPLFRDAASFGALFAHRQDFYRQAEVAVRAGGAGPAEVASRILQALGAGSVR